MVINLFIKKQDYYYYYAAQYWMGGCSLNEFNKIVLARLGTLATWALPLVNASDCLLQCAIEKQAQCHDYFD